jgi:phage terminase large subunit
MVATMLAGSVAGAATPRRVVLKTHAQRRIVVSQAAELAVSGGWYTGKSFPACVRALLHATQHPGARVAVLREERAAMKDSTEKTMRDEVMPASMLAWTQPKGLNRGWGWKASDDTFYLPERDGRQSIIVLAGLDKPQRFMGPNFSLVIVDQAEQLDGAQFEIARSRANRQADIPGGLVLLFNPEGGDHWANARYQFDLGNRTFDDDHGRAIEVAVCGQSDAFLFASPEYRAYLESLEGSWRDRYLLGKWTSFEGGVYAHYDPARHVIDRPAEWDRWGGYPPPDWPRSRSFDFGVNDPAVCLWFARDPSGREVCYRQVYRCDITDVDLAAMVVEQESLELAVLRAACDADDARNYASWLSEFRCESSWSDHDLNWRNNLARAGVWTQPAAKDLNTGILAVVEALKNDRIAIVRGSLVEPDARRLRDKLPTCVELEFGGYRWVRNKPVGQDHALDALRYKVNSDRARPAVGVWG